MKLTEWITTYPPFLAEVDQRIREEIIGVIIYESTLVCGEITDYQLTQPLEWEEAGSSTTQECTLCFEGRGKATASVSVEEGGIRTFHQEASLYGFVDLTFPEGAADAERFEAIYEKVGRVVRMEATGLDDG